MGSGDPGPEEVEWLDAEEQAHGRVRRALERRLATRRGRLGLALVATTAVVLSVTGAVLAWPEDSIPAAESATEDDAAELESRTYGLSPVPMRPRRGHEPVVVWEIVRQIEDRDSLEPRFRVVNRTTEAQEPTEIRVRGRFHDAPGLRFRARCTGPGPRAGGGSPRSVPAGRSVTVQCRDLTRYDGRRPRLDRSSVQVVPTRVPCESGGSGRPLG